MTNDSTDLSAFNTKVSQRTIEWTNHLLSDQINYKSVPNAKFNRDCIM